MYAIELTNHGSTSVFDEADHLRPDPAANQVRIDVDAIGVNFADIEHRRGRYPRSPNLPYIPGMEAAGTITAVGPDVEQSVGNRVVALVETGAYAESVVAPTDRVFTIPDTLSTDTAAGVPVQFLTAYHALHEWGRLVEDDRVLIHAAAGGVGTAAVQIAAVTGAEIFGTASTAEKLSLACDLGLDHPINYENDDLGERLNLNAIAIGLGLESVEYEPEQFPGLVYRLTNPDVVILLFGSGKVVITGGKAPDEAAKALSKIAAKLDELGLLEN